MGDLESDHKSQPIGSLASQVVGSLKIVDTTTDGSIGRPESSATRIEPTANSSPITMRRGEPGSSALPTLREAIARANPQATDRAIVASLPHSIASTLRPMYQDRIDPVYRFDTEFIGYASVPCERSAADLMTARQLVGGYLAPAAERQIKAELARLRVSTKARPESEDDLAMMFQVFAEECAEYPADVMVWALRGWAQRETFYPSLAELRDLLQRGARRRRSLMEALSRNSIATAA